METKPTSGLEKDVVVENALQSSRYLLAFMCFTYTCGAANEYWVINWMKMYGVNLPIFNSIVQNASWPLQIFIYLQVVKRSKTSRIITPTMFKNYLFLGSLAAFISLSRVFGLSTLPATLYVICANTEIVFETLMTKYILKRDVSGLQVIAVILVICAVTISLYDPTTKTYGTGDSTGQSSSVILMGVGLSLASRFASSLNTILVEKFLGKDAKSMFGVLECGVANAIVPFFLIPLTLTVIPEFYHWREMLNPPSSNTRTILTLLCIALCLSKLVDRLSKFGIVNESSTIFFAGVDSLMKMLAGFGSFFFFGEKITWCTILGFGLVVASVVVLYIDKRGKIKPKESDPTHAKKISPGRHYTLRTTDAVMNQLAQSGTCLCCSVQSCCRCCSVFSLIGYVFLMTIVKLLERQPIYIKGLKDGVEGAENCFHAVVTGVYCLVEIQVKNKMRKLNEENQKYQALVSEIEGGSEMVRLHDKLPLVQMAVEMSDDSVK